MEYSGGDDEFVEAKVNVGLEERNTYNNKNEYEIKIENNECDDLDTMNCEDVKVSYEIEQQVKDEIAVKCEEITIKSEGEDSPEDNTNVEEINLGYSQSDENSMFHCNQCDYETKHKGYIDRHQLSHKKVFNCLQCDYHTKYRSSLYVHMFRHRGVKFNCSDCDYQTIYKQMLKKHMLKHKELSECEMFSCSECDYRTKYKQGLESHMLEHNGEKFNCSKCDFQTEYKHDLKEHMLQHKGLSEVEMYTCDADENSTLSEYIPSTPSQSSSDDESFPSTSKSTNNETRTKYDSPLLIKNKYKKTICKFCDQEVVSKHFSRHLERKHGDEVEVKKVLTKKPNSKERNQLLSLIRNEGSLDDGLRGKIIPKKCKAGKEVHQQDYALCKYCKGFYKRRYLSRHIKNCFAKPSGSKDGNRPLSESFIYEASQRKYGALLNSLQAKKQIFERMQADEVTRTASSDILIVYYAEDLLKKIKMKRRFYRISNKIRECAKFLIEMRKNKSYDDLVSVLKPENFDSTIEAVKSLSRYDVSHRNFGAPSLALNFRTSLINLCDLAIKIIQRRKMPHLIQDIEQTLIELDRFKNMVDMQWAIEIGSLALKDLNEKSAIKPKLLCITEDIIKLAKLTEDKAEQAYQILLKNKKDQVSYRILVEAVLVETILHNRTRVRDVQYLEWHSLKQQFETDNTALQAELASSLTENETILTQNYKRIVSTGKGGRPVTILIPEKLFQYYKLLHKLRAEPWFPSGNSYFFTYPESKFWIDGCTVMQKYARLSNAKYPQLLTSCKLRKHIATVTQLLNLQSDGIDQLARFMGHQTHETFYKLPQDTYQIAKVSKLLQIMEKEGATKFKNQTLEEIDVDMHEIDSILEDDDKIEVCDTELPSCSEPAEQHTDGMEETTMEQNMSTYMNKTSKTGTRKRWSTVQKSLMKTYFREQIISKKALRKKECEDFVNSHRNDFDAVPWGRIKTFIFNEGRKNDSDQL